LGEQLKNFRSEGRVTLHEVSRETKIPVKYLEMIEDGAYDKLPPDVYVKGFLRSYAEFLGIEPRKIISLYQRERDIRSNLKGEKKNEKKTKKKTTFTRLVVTPRLVVGAAVVLAVLGGFYYLYREIGRFAAVPRLVVTKPAGDETISGNTISVSGFTDEDARFTINGQPVLVSDKGESKEDVVLQGGVNAIMISAENRFGKEASKTLNIKSDFQTPEIAKTNENGGKVIGEQDSKKSSVSVIVRADTDPIWLSVEADGNLVYSGTMLAGGTQTFEGEKEVRITSGKPNKTFIRVNGKNEKILADTPAIVRDVVFGPND
jgi:hypothetical protein